MSCAGDSCIESSAPFRQATLFCGEVVAFVGYVINKTHESVERGEAVALGLGQQVEGVIKIAARGTRDLVASGVGGLDVEFGLGCCWGRSMLRPHTRGRC